MGPGQAVQTLRGLMDASPAPHDARWDHRRSQIPMLVRTAEEKQLEEQAEANGALLQEALVEPLPKPAPRKKVGLDHPMFYGPIGDIVREIDPMTEASPIGVLASLLTMCGNYLGRDFYVPVGADRHFPTLHTLLIGSSALARKGTAGNLGLLVMREIDKDWVDNNVARALNSGQGIVQTVKNRNDESHEANGINDRRMLFLITEFGDVLIKARISGCTIMPTLRDAWDSGDLDNTSVTRPTRVRGASVGVLGMITSEELKDQLDLKQLATGSLNRLLLVQVERSKEIDGHPPIIESKHFAEPVARLRGNLERVRDARPPFVQVANTGCPLVLSDKAMVAARRIKKAKETKGENWIEAGNQRAYVQILRVAIVYAVADGASRIEPAHLQAAEAFVDYAATGIVELGTGELQDVVPQRILTYMQAEPTRAVARSEISNDVFHRNAPSKQLEESYRLLKKLGLIEEHTVKPPKGRPTTVYRLRAN
jgi:hypothetical protein